MNPAITGAGHLQLARRGLILVLSLVLLALLRPSCGEHQQLDTVGVTTPTPSLKPETLQKHHHLQRPRGGVLCLVSFVCLASYL